MKVWSQLVTKILALTVERNVYTRMIGVFYFLKRIRTYHTRILLAYANETNHEDQSAWSRGFIYNSNLSSLSAELSVGEVNPFAQKALDSYHGYVRLRLVERHYQPPPRLAAVLRQAVHNNRKTVAALGGKAVASAADKNLVCEVLLSLPKV